MSFKRELIKHDNVLELRVSNKQGSLLYAIFVIEYGRGDLSTSIIGVRSFNFKLTNRAFRYELNRIATMSFDLLSQDTEEDLFETA